MAAKLQLSENEFSLLCDVTESLHTIRDMDDMLHAVFAKIKPIFDIEGASIALHDPERKDFYFILTVEGRGGKKVIQKENMRFPDHLGVAGWVMDRRRAVVVNDVSQNGRFYTGMDGKQNFITKSMICVPLQTRKGFLGVLYALNKKKGEFTEREKNILEILSGSIAVSLENARLYGELKNHVHSLEREKKILQSQIQARTGYDDIIGSSKPMRRMFELLDKIIDTSTTVLIQGETGTGKELIARVIHYNGPLKDMPFIAENCGALPDNLLESELFGHIRGSFTGAIADKKGLFEIADGGTIFLDEIGEMSMHMQVKLLRVLQEGEFRPVGSGKARHVNVRLIASTNRDLAEEVKKKNFREDLYYRINVFQITAPPLREREDDIRHLAIHFLTKFARKANRPAPEITPGALDLLIRFYWPGNVRELENEMERALAMAGKGQYITEDILSDKIRSQRKNKLFDEAHQLPGSMKEAIRNVEIRMIMNALAEAGGNRSRAAGFLGISRQGLLNKIAKYNLAA